MKKQAGLKKITLYENKNAIINYDTFSIITDGNVIEIEHFPELIVTPDLVVINYKIFAQLNDLNKEDVDTINDSVYGWIAQFEFHDLTTKVVDRPFFREEMSNLNTNISHSRKINLESWNRQGLIDFN